VYSGISQRNHLSLQKRRSLETVAEDAFGTNRSRAEYSQEYALHTEDENDHHLDGVLAQ
jgi:hypothetical protein